MAGTIQCDYLQPSSSAGLTIQTPTGNNILSMNSAGIFSSGGSLFLAANGQIVSFSTNYPGYISANNGVYSANNYTGPFTNGIVMDYASSNGQISVSGSSGIKFFNNGVANNTLLTIDSNGNMGLGVTPSAWTNLNYKIFQNNAGFLGSYSNTDLVIGQNWYDSGTAAYKYITSNYATFYSQAGGVHKWFNAPSGTAGNAISFTQVMTLDASGNLGLGVTPSTGWSGKKAVQVGAGACVYGDASYGGQAVLGANIYSGASGNIYYLNTAAASLYSQYAGTHYWFNAVSGTAGTVMSPTQAMTLDVSGKLGLGATSPSSYFHLSSGGNTVAHVIMQNNNSAIMIGKFISSYNNAAAATLFSMGTGGNSGVMVKIIIRGASAVTNIMYEDVGYAWWRWGAGGGYQGSGVSSVTTVTNVVGTHNVGTLSWSNPSTAPVLKYTQGSNGYISESIDVYVIARDYFNGLTFDATVVAYG